MNAVTGPIQVVIKCPNANPSEKAVLRKAIREASDVCVRLGTVVTMVDLAVQSRAILDVNDARAAGDFINLLRGMGFEAKLHQGVQ